MTNLVKQQRKVDDAIDDIKTLRDEFGDQIIKARITNIDFVDDFHVCDDGQLMWKKGIDISCVHSGDWHDSWQIKLINMQSIDRYIDDCKEMGLPHVATHVLTQSKVILDLIDIANDNESLLYDLQQSVATLSIQVDDLESEYTDLVSDFTTEISNLQSMIEDRDKSIKKYEENEGDFIGQIQYLENKNEKLVDENNCALDTIFEMSQRIEALEKELQSYTAKSPDNV